MFLIVNVTNVYETLCFQMLFFPNQLIALSKKKNFLYMYICIQIKIETTETQKIETLLGRSKHNFYCFGVYFILYDLDHNKLDSRSEYHSVGVRF